VIILAIIVLFIISLALRVASSGVSTLQKVNDRAIKIGSKVTMKATDKAADASSKALSKATPSNSSKINKTKNTVKRGKNSAIKAGSKGVQVMNKAVGKSTVLVLKFIRVVVDSLRRLLIAVLPLVLVVDVIVFVLLTVAASSVTLLFTNNDDGSSVSYSRRSSGNNGSISGNGSSDSTSNVGDIGNSTLAEAAVSLAGSSDTPIYFDGVWGPDSPALNCSELKLYKDEHDKAAPGDIYYASCDRGVFTAVMYAEIDNDFPRGPVSAINSYLSSSSKWKYIGTDDGSTTLEPGDVLISDSHVCMHVGNEAVKKKFPDSDADRYEASYGDWFPYVFKGNHNGNRIYRYVGG